MQLILASQSPRRLELMKKITPDFSVCVSQADESLPIGISPTQAVAMLAERKARAVFDLPREEPCGVIGADTVVEAEGELLGKPADAAEARRMLRLFSGGTHRVHTGLTVLTPGGSARAVVTTEVDFYPLTDREIDRYVASGEPFDKAGGYGIQTRAALFVRGIRGDYYNVMGFPIATLYRLLQELGLL